MQYYILSDLISIPWGFIPIIYSLHKVNVMQEEFGCTFYSSLWIILLEIYVTFYLLVTLTNILLIHLSATIYFTCAEFMATLQHWKHINVFEVRRDMCILSSVINTRKCSLCSANDYINLWKMCFTKNIAKIISSYSLIQTILISKC